MSEENKIYGGDERVKKSAGAPIRGDRATADAERTNKDGTALTKEERMRMISSEWSQDILPTPPVVPGWHFCWLSTTNASDPIYRRVQKGYQPVTVNDLPGFATYKVTQGEFEGCIACNEMVLFKIEDDVYQFLMTKFHYNDPNDSESSIKQAAAPQGQDSNGRNLGQVEGFDNLARKVRQPTFA